MLLEVISAFSALLAAHSSRHGTPATTGASIQQSAFPRAESGVNAKNNGLSSFLPLTGGNAEFD